VSGAGYKSSMSEADADPTLLADREKQLMMAEESLANTKRIIATTQKNAAKGAGVLTVVEDTYLMHAMLPYPSPGFTTAATTAIAELSNQVLASLKCAARTARMAPIMEKMIEVLRTPGEDTEERMRALDIELRPMMRKAKEASAEESRAIDASGAACANMQLEVRRMKERSQCAKPVTDGEW
jgi:hypothetical protein